MPDQPEDQDTEETQDESAEAKPLGLVQYPAPSGQTQYGTYQNPNK